jgi:hypothetical protein
MTNIMDIEVAVLNGKVRIKFVAFVGETGPELIMPETMARDLLNKLISNLDAKQEAE